jgi:hypothetical protein
MLAFLRAMKSCSASSIAGSSGLPNLVGALRGVETALGLPLLDRVVVGDARAVERGLEIGLRVRAAEIVLAGRHLAESVDRLRVLGQVDALRASTCIIPSWSQSSRTSRTRGEPALQPARRVQHEVDARHHGRQQRLRALVGGLRVGQLGGAERAAGAERHPEPPRELPRRCRARSTAPACRTSAPRSASTSSSRTCRRSPARRAARAG